MVSKKRINYIDEIKLSSWKDFKEIALNSKLEWIYRGQSNSRWNLSTTLERSKIQINFDDFEKELLYEFRKGAKFYLNQTEIPTSSIEWIAMLQHYGAPTRLLDFTKSPYIAAYFAFEELNQNSNEVAIWRLIKANSLYVGCTI